MLMPYYIAALNIEHAFFELTRQYEPFDGLCFVDTLDMAEDLLSIMSEENTHRVQRQKDSPITVVIGNPPYNTNQLSENDNNRNRAYRYVDRRVGDTYAAASTATLRNKLYDPYCARFFRWATDRLQNRDGVVCFVSNNSFVEDTAFDGMRAHLHSDFARIYHIDLKGSVRDDPTKTGTSHNVFGIQVGVGITIAVKKTAETTHRIWYAALPVEWRREQKLKWLTDAKLLTNVQWKEVFPDSRHTWIPVHGSDAFSQLVPLGTKAAKSIPTDGYPTGSVQNVFARHFDKPR